ncbi:MEKHLA domain-containing protein [Nitrosomonas marina]|uniref:MEKHLA domain-containing protein n=1 Tax=Nitrosomonas marina TaxID=917 RepID=A0A1H8AS84_9PROT|nr:MEKHLA domain-containing protein [Nitrosomonas marina]SEM72824.1 MEKHLA domain-containing protein [Nitrosomonas marina]
MSTQTDWKSPQMLRWCQYLLDSYAYWTGKELIPRKGTTYEQASYLFNCSFVVVSHQAREDPILNYGNQTALNLWEMDWCQFTKTPSRMTAEPVNREERARVLQQARTHGYIADYRGVRISSTGKRFLVDQAIVWNILNSDGITIGQGATFSIWHFL